MFCPNHGEVTPAIEVTEDSIDRCPICEHALSFDMASALDFDGLPCPQCEGNDSQCMYCQGIGRVSEKQADEWHRQNF